MFTPCADPFCSVYSKDYRFFKVDNFPEPPDTCTLYESEGNFIPLTDFKLIYDPQRDDDLINRLMLKRMKTTYQLSYKPPDSLKDKSTEEFTDEFMKYFNKVFDRKEQPLLRPPHTSKRLFGYSRYDYYYTSLSTYQEEISFEAYKIFKKDFDQGISRLFAKKEKAEQKREQGEEHKMREETAEKEQMEKAAKSECWKKSKLSHSGNR